MRRPPVSDSTSPCTETSTDSRARFSLSSSLLARRSMPVMPWRTQSNPAGPVVPPCTRAPMNFSASSAWAIRRPLESSRTIARLPP